MSTLQDERAKMKEDVKSSASQHCSAGASRRSGISRRDLLKSGAAAMPAVLTLPSGAALAASSVYIGTTTSDGSRYAGGRLCLDTSKAEPLPNGTTYKFINTNYADVYVVRDGDYYPSIGKSGTPIKADAFCQTGGTRFLDGKPDGEAVMPENVGSLVSMTAINSITAALDVDLKYLP